jgi:hypothetical protein
MNNKYFMGYMEYKFEKKKYIFKLLSNKEGG